MDLAARIVALVFGFIAAVLSYPFYDEYLVALLAFVAAIATGALAYVVVERLLAAVVGGSSTRRW